MDAGLDGNVPARGTADASVLATVVSMKRERPDQARPDLSLTCHNSLHNISYRTLQLGSTVKVPDKIVARAAGARCDNRVV